MRTPHPHLKSLGIVEVRCKFVSRKESKKLNLALVIFKFKIQQRFYKKLNEEIRLSGTVILNWKKFFKVPAMSSSPSCYHSLVLIGN